MRSIHARLKARCTQGLRYHLRSSLLWCALWIGVRERYSPERIITAAVEDELHADNPLSPEYHLARGARGIRRVPV